MNENIELIKYIYQNAEMGFYACKKIIKSLEQKDNKIKDALEDIMNKYEFFFNESRNIILDNSYKIKDVGLFTKVGASMGIKAEVSTDNSDSAIAKLLIQGLTMGILDIKAHIKNLRKDVNKDIKKIASEYLKFQDNSVNKLNKFL